MFRIVLKATVRQPLRQAKKAARRTLSYNSLSDTEIVEAQKILSDWNIVSFADKTALSKTFEFENFVDAWSFMSGVALQVETLSRVSILQKHLL